MKTPNRKVTVVYGVPVGSYGSTLICTKRITIKAGESIETAFNRTGYDICCVWHVIEGWPKMIKTDWSKPL